MQPRDLIATARQLVGRGKRGQPRQSNLKRALSTAYYAMFHALCRNCADALIGTAGANRSQPAWNQAYRAVEHGYVRIQCEKSSVIVNFPRALQDFGNKFMDLQRKRKLADYDPGYRVNRSEALIEIDVAENMIRQLMASDIKHKRAFAVWVTMKNRVN